MVFRWDLFAEGYYGGVEGVELGLGVGEFAAFCLYNLSRSVGYEALVG